MPDQKQKLSKITDCMRKVISKVKHLSVQICSVCSHIWKHILVYKWLYGLLLSLSVAVLIFAVERETTQKTMKMIEDVKVTTEADSLALEELSHKVDKMQRMQELNQLSISSIQMKKVTPPLRIFSEEPYREFSCFDYEIFHVVKENEKEILFSNEESNPVVSFFFTYTKETRVIAYKPEAIHFNENNPKVSYKNYLDYLLFIKAQFNNARLVFWDLLEDKPLLRTGPAMPVNLRYDHEKSDALISFVSKMVRIEHFLGRKIPFQMRPSKSVLQDVNYVYEVLSGRPMSIGFKYEKELKNVKEKEEFLKHFWRMDFRGIEYRMEGKSDVVEIYGVPIELGMWTINFPPAKVTPSIEDLKKDKSNDPVTVSVTTKTRDKEIVLIHNTLRKKHKLIDPPIPLFP